MYMNIREQVQGMIREKIKKRGEWPISERKKIVEQNETQNRMIVLTSRDFIAISRFYSLVAIKARYKLEDYSTLH